MKFIFAALAVPALVAAQVYGPAPGPATTSSSSSAPAPTPSAAPGQQFVTVSPNLAFAFSPNNLTAAVNDTITFLFPTSGGFEHSVTQSSFAAPCTPLDGGFNSALQPNGWEFTITITNASAPIWFFCQQTNPVKHCGMGMVGGINIQPGPNSIEAFVAAASSIGNNEAAQTVTAQVLTGAGATAAAPASTSIAPAPTTSQPSGAERLLVGAGSLSAGLVAAIYMLA
ncbi:Cupredoxin [Ramaria rubella]|nr:Cupredoxin [Ramaria rubella]